MSTIKMIATLHVAAEVRDQIRADMLKLVPLSRAESGCIKYDLYDIDQQGAPGVANTGGDFAVFEEWVDGEALQSHTSSDHFQSFAGAYSGDQLKISLQMLNEAQ